MRLVPERAALVATLLTEMAASEDLAATVGRLMAGARLVAMAARAAGTATRRPGAALGAMRVVPGRAALAAALLAELAAPAVTAATVGRLMAAARLVAMAATEFCLVMAARRAATAARRSEEMVASEDLANLPVTAA